MKNLILLILSTFTCIVASAQFEIRYNGQGDDLAGTIYDVTVAAGTAKEVKMWVLNTGATSQDVYITRVRQDVPVGWLDQEMMCWPPACYIWTNSGDTHTTPIPTTPTITPGAISSDTLMSETSGGAIAEMKPSVTAAASATGSALFKYYLTDANGVFLDSVGIRFNIGQASINETQSIDLTVAPNPASNNLTVDFDGANSADLKMVDVLGNVVLEKTITGKETINVSSFRNGIYFVAVSSEGRKPVVRKVIVRH